MNLAKAKLKNKIAKDGFDLTKKVSARFAKKMNTFFQASKNMEKVQPEKNGLNISGMDPHDLAQFMAAKYAHIERPSVHKNDDGSLEQIKNSDLSNGGKSKNGLSLWKKPQFKS